MVSLKTITTAAALASVACAFPSGVRLATRQAGEMTSEMASAGATAEGAQTTQSAESNAAARGSQAEAGKGAGAEAGAGAGAKAGAGAGAEGAASGQAAVDQKVVQFAGGLEHLETAFYRQCMQSDKLTASDKTAISQILDTEDKHTVKMQLTAVALGSQPIKACKYKFPLEDRNSIMALALMLEETGQAAYLGAAPLISQDVALPLAGAILPIEAQHATVIRQLMSSGGEGGVGVESAGQRGAVPAVPRAFSTSMSARAVSTLVKGLIESCDEGSNPANVFPPFPTLEMLPESQALAASSETGAMQAGSMLRLAVVGGEANGLEKRAEPGSESSSSTEGAAAGGAEAEREGAGGAGASEGAAAGQGEETGMFCAFITSLDEAPMGAMFTPYMKGRGCEVANVSQTRTVMLTKSMSIDDSAVVGGPMFF